MLFKDLLFIANDAEYFRECNYMCASKHYSHTINDFLCLTIKLIYVFVWFNTWTDTIIKIIVVEIYVIIQWISEKYSKIELMFIN